MFANRLPRPLKQLSRLAFDYLDGDSIDFEPYGKFMSKSETREWLAAWTGNEEADASAYRVFGQDGTGGLAAIWLVRDGQDILEQPIVFFGSEGEVGVVAQSFGDFAWMLAQGVGPCEAVLFRARSGRAVEEIDAFAERYAPGQKRPVKDIIETAQSEFESFPEDIERLCR